MSAIITNFTGVFHIHPVATQPAGLRLQMTLSTFREGYEAGRHADPITDVEFIDAIRSLIEEGQFTETDTSTLEFALGSLLGVCVG